MAVLAGGCVHSVSYAARTHFHDPRHTAGMISAGGIAVLPVLTPRGPAAAGALEAEAVAGRLRALRPDLAFVGRGEFERGFPPRFDRRKFAEFYDRIFMEKSLAVESLDSLWAFAGQPYLLVYTLRDGAAIRNVDESHFKHVTLTCELLSREGRKVVWRASCKGVSDDRRVTDGEILAESMRLLAEALPSAVPDYGRESW